MTFLLWTTLSICTIMLHSETGIFAPATVFMLTFCNIRPVLKMWFGKYWLHLTACTWLFSITVLESSGSDEKASFFFFQISAKNKDIRQYGEAVSFDVRTKEKGENNASVMCLIYMCTCFWGSALKCQLIA